MPKASEAVLHYIAYHRNYYGVAYPKPSSLPSAPRQRLDMVGRLVYILLFLAPAALGLLAGWIAQNGFIYDFVRRLGSKPIHIVPPLGSGDSLRCPGEWIVVTLKNGNAYGAECGDGSFISTEPGERVSI